MSKKNVVFILLFIALPAIFCAACTSLMAPDPNARDTMDYGARESLRICVLIDEGVSDEKAKQLINHVSQEFSNYGLEISVPWTRQWKRQGFSSQGIAEQLWQVPLEAPCDRLLAFIGRHAGDFLVGLLGVEILGAVDERTHTRGYVVAQWASLNQVFRTPSDTALHESHHLLGCRHEALLAKCYTQIRDIKLAAQKNRALGNDFFPGISSRGTPLTSREETDLLLRSEVRSVNAKREADRKMQGLTDCLN